MILYLSSRFERRSGKSFTPLGKPLYPRETTRLFGSTMTAPVFVEGSLLHWATCSARAKKRLSHFSVRWIWSATDSMVVSPFVKQLLSERVEGIGPSLRPWQGRVMPLDHTRKL